MSRAHNRMKLRQALDNIEVLGAFSPSLSLTNPQPRFAAPSLFSAPAASAPTSSPDMTLRPLDGYSASAAPAPTSSFQLRDPSTMFQTPYTYSPPSAPAPAAAPAPSPSAPPLVSAPPSPASPAPYGAPAGKPPTGFFSRNMPGFNRPVWQFTIGAVGILAIGLGAYKLVSISGSPRRMGYSR